MNSNDKLKYVLPTLCLLCFLLIYMLEFRPISGEIKELEEEIFQLSEELAKHQEKEPENEGVEIDNEIYELDMDLFPKELRAQEQIRYYMSLEQWQGMELSNMQLGTEEEIGTLSGREIKGKELSLDYVADSYEIFRGFYEAILGADEPVSIRTFSMSINDNGEVLGQMKLAQFYAPSEETKDEKSVEDGVAIGVFKIFANE